METNNNSFNWKFFGKIFLSFSITVALFYFIFTYTDWRGVLNTILQIPIPFLFLFAFIFLTVFLFRTIRISLFLQKKIPLLKLFLITIVHNTLAQLIPFRLGEFSFIYFTRKLHTVSEEEALLSLVLVRIFDFVTVSILLIISFFIAKKVSAETIPIEFHIFYVAFPIILGLLLVYIRKTLTILHTLCQQKCIKESSWIQHLSKRVENMISCLHTIYSKKIFLIAFILSLGIWIFYSFFLYLVFDYLGVSVSYTLLLFISSATILFSSIPIQGFAGFGTVEVSWTIFLLLIGIEKITALEIAFAVHSIGIFIIVILGLCSYFLLRLVNKMEKKEQLTKP